MHHTSFSYPNSSLGGYKPDDLIKSVSLEGLIGFSSCRVGKKKGMRGGEIVELLSARTCQDPGHNPTDPTRLF